VGSSVLHRCVVEERSLLEHLRNEEKNYNCVLIEAIEYKYMKMGM
jgi:hypothetical protein